MCNCGINEDNQNIKILEEGTGLPDSYMQITRLEGFELSLEMSTPMSNTSFSL